MPHLDPLNRKSRVKNYPSMIKVWKAFKKFGEINLNFESLILETFAPFWHKNSINRMCCGTAKMSGSWLWSNKIKSCILKKTIFRLEFEFLPSGLSLCSCNVQREASSDIKKRQRQWYYLKMLHMWTIPGRNGSNI